MTITILIQERVDIRKLVGSTEIVQPSFGNLKFRKVKEMHFTAIAGTCLVLRFPLTEQ